MKKLGKYLALLLVIVGTFWSLPAGMHAQTGNRAALVVRHSDNKTETVCVEFEEPQISGFDLIQRSGLNIEIEAQGLGALVCSINDTGCPASNCWCQCSGGVDCIYWSYWHKLQEGWRYSQAGSTVYQVQPGAVEGWSWGPGAVNQAIAPQEISFEEVCLSPATETATPLPSPTASNTPMPIIVNPFDTATPILATVNTAVPGTPTSAGTSASQSEMTAIPTIPVTNTPILTSQVITATPIGVIPTQEQEIQPPANETASPLPQAEFDEPASIAEAPPPSETPPAGPGTDSRKSDVVSVRQSVETPKETPQVAELRQEVAVVPAQTAETLTVIGSGIVPTRENIESQMQTFDQERAEFSLPDWFPYLIFLIIIGGLTAFLIILSLRRKSRGV